MERSNHEVFISFRGEDTRYSFTGHLYDALRRLTIKTYIDNNLQRGEQISSALIKAIEGSKISVVVFSEHYADSVWCLDELVKIIECKNRYEQIVVPIFYDVDPSTVRRQTGKYAEHFLKHKRRYNLQRVENWRAALAEAANLSGWDCSAHRREGRTESELVAEIANDILQRLHGVGRYDDLASEIAMCERMAQSHMEEYMRTRDVNHFHKYNELHQRIAQLKQQQMVRVRGHGVA